MLVEEDELSLDLSVEDTEALVFFRDASVCSAFALSENESPFDAALREVVRCFVFLNRDNMPIRLVSTPTSP